MGASLNCTVKLCLEKKMEKEEEGENGEGKKGRKLGMMVH